MNIPYRTRRKLKTLGMVLLVVLLLGILAWFCSVIFLERYVVYSREGAELDFNISSQEIHGELAEPPVGEKIIEVLYNEGSNAMDDNSELRQLNGYYIDSNLLATDIDNIWSMLEPLEKGTPIMIELKGPQGTFFYESALPDAIPSTTVSVTGVKELIRQMHIKGFYTIARVSTMRDYTFGLNHVLSGLPLKGKQYLWADREGKYWLNPSSPSTVDWICSYVNELKAMGFNEVMLADFRFPDTDKIGFNGDKEASLVAAANTILEKCAGGNFTISFGVATPSFPLPEGRCRMYLTDVEAQDVGKKLSHVTIPEPSIKLVFVAPTNDTRYEVAGVLRSITAAEVLEEQKAEQKAKEEAEAKQNPDAQKDKKGETKPKETSPAPVG